MLYQYKCINNSCEQYDIKVIIDKPMSVYDKEEVCECCNNILVKQYNIGGIVTGDGCK